MECFDSGAILSSSSHAALTKSEVLSYLQILQIRAQEENIDFGLYPWYHVQNLRCLMASWLWLNPSVSSLKHAILGVYPNLRNTLMMLQTTCSQKSVMQYLKISPQRRLQDWGKTPTDYHRFIVSSLKPSNLGVVLPLVVWNPYFWCWCLVFNHFFSGESFGYQETISTSSLWAILSSSLAMLFWWALVGMTESNVEIQTSASILYQLRRLASIQPSFQQKRHCQTGATLLSFKTSTDNHLFSRSRCEKKRDVTKGRFKKLAFPFLLLKIG